MKGFLRTTTVTTGSSSNLILCRSVQYWASDRQEPETMELDHARDVRPWKTTSFTGLCFAGFTGTKKLVTWRWDPDVEQTDSNKPAPANPSKSSPLLSDRKIRHSSREATLCTLWWPMECHLLLTIMSKTLKGLANPQLSILEKGFSKNAWTISRETWKSCSNFSVASDFSASYSWHFLAFFCSWWPNVAMPGQACVRSQVLLLRKEVTTGSFPRLRVTATYGDFKALGMLHWLTGHTFHTLEVFRTYVFFTDHTVLYNTYIHILILYRFMYIFAHSQYRVIVWKYKIWIWIPTYCQLWGQDLALKLKARPG